MGQKGTKLLKVLFLFIVFTVCTLTCLSKATKERAITLSASKVNYNSIPYKETTEVNASNISFKDVSKNKVLDTYKGTITAYGPDCIGCIGITAAGFKVINDGVATITYEDAEYGTVRVLAAAPSAFPYGTIVKVTGSRIDGYILGIVLDTGGAMRNAWANGEVLMDLLFESESNKEVYEFGRQKEVTFEILRYGR